MELTFDRVLGILGIVLAIVLAVLDKAGKLKGPVLLAWLGVAALMTLPLAFGNSWVKNTPWGMLKFSKGVLMLSIVTFCYSVVAIWISPASGENSSAGEGERGKNKESRPAEPSVDVKPSPIPPERIKTKTASLKPQSTPKPEISAEFVNATSPGIAVINLTEGVALREAMISISAWNLDTKINLPVFAYTEKGIFVKKGTAVIIGSFDNPVMKSFIKVGEHVLGLVMVDCPDCSTARYYWVFFVYGGESWYSPIPVGATINIVEIAQRIYDANWDVDEFMKQVPHGDRLKPRKP